MATLADYHTALATFVASPSEDTKAAVIGARAALPDQVSADGVATVLPKITDLDTTLSATIAGASRSDPKRFIRAGVRHAY